MIQCSVKIQTEIAVMTKGSNIISYARNQLGNYSLMAKIVNNYTCEGELRLHYQAGVKDFVIFCGFSQEACVTIKSLFIIPSL